MIPDAYITEWQQYAPWKERSQIEQDLVLSRALVEIYDNKDLADSLAFRGGTALNKLILGNPVRYSEDIDLVQMTPKGIGQTFDIVRARLEPWLGPARRKIGRGPAKFEFRFRSTIEELPLKLKVEINTREHFSVLGFVNQEFTVKSNWFSGQARITTFALEELLATKLRALFQRKKGRDLFDVWYLTTTQEVDIEKSFDIF